VNELLAAVRIRGRVNIRDDIKDTLGMLRLNRINHCVLVPETTGFIGMLKKAKDWITWGKIDKKTAVKLFEARGMMAGRKKLMGSDLKRLTKHESFESFVDELMKGKVKMNDYPGIKPVFRLNPPKHGYKATRLPYPKGDLGNRKEKINELLERMI